MHEGRVIQHGKPDFVFENPSSIDVAQIVNDPPMTILDAEIKDGKCYNKITGKRIAACVPMHTFGLPMYIDELVNVCNEFNIPLVEDAAESIGSFYKNTHTGRFGLLGVFSFNCIGIEGSIIQSISHGFVSGGMFLMVGILYDRYHSRLLYYYSGLVHLMPIYSVLLLIFTMANIALPGTSSFVGEFLLLTGIYKVNILASVISALGVILCGAYSLWLYNRVIFGNLKINHTLLFKDIHRRFGELRLETFPLVDLLVYKIFHLV
jgi:hypothetical protein